MADSAPPRPASTGGVIRHLNWRWLVTGLVTSAGAWAVSKLSERGYFDFLPDRFFLALLALVGIVWIIFLWTHPDVRAALARAYNRKPKMFTIIFIVSGAIIGATVAGIGVWTIKRQEQQKVASAPPTQPKPQVGLGGYVMPKNRYPVDSVVEGILWDDTLSEIRFEVANGDIPIHNLDIEIVLDKDVPTNETAILDVVQLTKFPGVTTFPSGEQLPPLSFQALDKKGKPAPMNVSRFSSNYRIHCENVIANSRMRFLIAAIVFDPKGGPPNEDRLPQKLDINGGYDTSGPTGVEHYPVKISGTLAQFEKEPFLIVPTTKPEPKRKGAK